MSELGTTLTQYIIEQGRAQKCSAGVVWTSSSSASSQRSEGWLAVAVPVKTELFPRARLKVPRVRAVVCFQSV